ncbi:MAG: Crp/Fnr family transcriptional regulator [Chloroflexi bacterium]|nr:MAG: Crp/Fnr family transcriptional regulator [Chloroflexota bacterium]
MIPAVAQPPSKASADPLRLLAATAIFDGMSELELERLRPALRARKFAKDSYLFREGDPGSHLYVVVQGEVKIVSVTESGAEIVFGVVGPGEVIGELSVFVEDGERSTDAVALVTTECLAIPKEAVVSFFLDHPKLLLRLVTSLAAFVRRKDAAVAEVAFLDIPGRVANKLLELAESKGVRDGEAVTIRVPLSQRTLAGMVGASRENVNRTLSRFKELGYITQSHGTITVLKPDELRRRGRSAV